MKTRFIFHGGFAPSQVPEDDAFYTEALKGTGNSPKILLVYFAKEADRTPKNQAEDIAQFEKNKGNKALSFEVADENDFPEQVHRSDVIYLHGGRTAKILPALARFPGLKKMFEGKIVAGDSAGANVLPAYFYGHHERKIFEGLDIVPVKLFCHYTEDQKGELSKLEQYRPDLKTVVISEYQTKVIEQNG